MLRVKTKRWEGGDICRHAYRASCTCTESKTCSGSGLQLLLLTKSVFSGVLNSRGWTLF